jgi:hypothetical protein
LYAVMHDVAFSVREVRPHELLNYFSFDTVTPDADQTFDVLASAEQNGDQLSVALAVKGATPPALPLDLTLVVDRSGSMSAEGRMDYTAASKMTEQLQRATASTWCVRRASAPFQTSWSARHPACSERHRRCARTGATDVASA